MLPGHGEVWWCEFPEIRRRPVVVLSRDAAILARRLVVLAPCSTTDRNLPSEVRLSPDVDPVPRECVVSMDSLESASVAHLVERLGRLGSDRMHQICAALAVAVDCQP
jgi:mRNA interferase MazF